MRRPSMRVFTIVALAVAVGLGAAVSPFASGSPDGLARVAKTQSFADRSTRSADYAFPGVHDKRLANGLAGFTGTLGVFVVGYGLAFVIRRRHVTPA